MRHLVALALVCGVPGAALADDKYDNKYKEPPAVIRDVLRAPLSPQVMVSPSGKLALWARPQRKQIAQLAAPMLKLAGIRLNPRTNGFHEWGYMAGGYTLRQLPDGKERAIQMPSDLAFGGPTWNADETGFAFVGMPANGVELWIADTRNATARRVPGVALNPLLGSFIQWMPDGKTLLVKTVAANRGAAPAEKPPTGPTIHDSSGFTRASGTYENRDLLQTPHDADLFAYYATAQLALVDTRTMRVTRIGKPDVLGTVRVAPNGKHVLVSRIKRPYSYRATWQRFANDVEVWGLDGRMQETVASLPVADQVPIQGVATGPRGVQFVPTAPATLLWAEALDQGDWSVKAARRDRLVLKEIGKPARTWLELDKRWVGIDYLEDGATALVTEYDRDRRWQRTLVTKLGDAATPSRTLWDRSINDAYGDPGSPVYKLLPNGRYAVRTDGTAIFLSGDGATPDGNRPFLDRLDLATGKTERLFRSDKASLESFVELVDPAKGTFLTIKESPKDPPNLALHTLGQPIANAPAGEATRATTSKLLTAFPDPQPQIRGITKQLHTFKRADGTQLSFTLYLPPNHQAGTRLPVAFWAYPTEFSDPATAGQVQAAPNEFTTIWGASFQLLALAGYAVIEVSMPLVGPTETVYDTFVEQLNANAKAAIDKVVELGVGDRERVGVFGHSHGALMTANLLAYSNLFRAGVARSGAFNHTLRPFGFQTEHRPFYKARDTYLKLSPTINADKIDEPLLIIHGQIDANPGTVPLQSEKLFEAVRGVGGTTRLVMLPFESHGYAARESIEHTVAETIEWFDRHVKNAKPRPAPPPSTPVKTKPPAR